MVTSLAISHAWKFHVHTNSRYSSPPAELRVKICFSFHLYEVMPQRERIIPIQLHSSSKEWKYFSIDQNECHKKCIDDLFAFSSFFVVAFSRRVSQTSDIEIIYSHKKGTEILWNIQAKENSIQLNSSGEYGEKTWCLCKYNIYFHGHFPCQLFQWFEFISFLLPIPVTGKFRDGTLLIEKREPTV